MSAFFRGCLIAAFRRKSALEERIVHDVAFAALAVHDPVAAMNLSLPLICLDRLRGLALLGIY